MRTMDYKTAREYIDGINLQKGTIPGLDNIKRLLEYMKNPQNDVPLIHVAGTNGKGSFSAMLSSILRKAGYNTGMYVSPSVFEYNERIQLNGENIPDDDYAYEIENIKKCIDNYCNDESERPTAFEIETVAAFNYFKRKKCDIAIIETGMGGRCDATNVFDNPVVSVIMSISMDHMKFLGETLYDIAMHKAGIIKKNRPVVLYNQAEEIVKVIENVAKSKESTLTVTGNATHVLYDNSGITFSYKDSNGNDYENIKLNLAGTYQPDNCSVVIEVVNILNGEGFNITFENLYEGIASARWNGRFEKISSNPDFYIDGAHNPGAALRLKESIDKYFKNKNLIYIQGVLSDKNYEEIEKILASDAEIIYTVTPNNIRGLSADELAKCISKFNKNVVAIGEIDEAVNNAINKAEKLMEKNGQESVVIAFGSLSYLSDVKKSIKQSKSLYDMDRMESVYEDRK